jgi:hypothetical protein
MCCCLGFNIANLEQSVFSIAVNLPEHWHRMTVCACLLHIQVFLSKVEHMTIDGLLPPARVPGCQEEQPGMQGCQVRSSCTKTVVPCLRSAPHCY